MINGYSLFNIIKKYKLIIMSQFVLDLKEGTTFEEIMSVSPARTNELADAILAEITSTNIKTQPEALQIICKHCRNLNELAYYIFLSGKQFDANDVAQRGPGFMSLRRTQDGGLSLDLDLI
jgi:hypothetical protein